MKRVIKKMGKERSVHVDIYGGLLFMYLHIINPGRTSLLLRDEGGEERRRNIPRSLVPSLIF